MSEQLKRRALAQAEAAQDAADEQRPNREELSREAGRWPRGGPVRWMGRKGRLLIKRTGRFGALPFHTHTRCPLGLATTTRASGSGAPSQLRPSG